MSSEDREIKGVGMLLRTFAAGKAVRLDISIERECSIREGRWILRNTFQRMY